MTVYVVECGVYHEREIVGVYATLDAAKRGRRTQCRHCTGIGCLLCEGGAVVDGEWRGGDGEWDNGLDMQSAITITAFVVSG